MRTNFWFHLDPNLNIAYSIFMIVMDSNVLVAALRSRTGSSRVLLQEVLLGRCPAGVSVPLFLEYEAVLTRKQNLEAFGLNYAEVKEFLNGLAGVLKPIEITYLWRPQLSDASDEMVLEAAVNGKVTHLITWNTRDFFPAAEYFRLKVCRPEEYI